MKTSFKTYTRNGFHFFEMKGSAGKLTFGVSKVGLVLKNFDSMVESFEEWSKTTHPEGEYWSYDIAVFKGKDKAQGTLTITRIGLEYIKDCKKDMEAFHKKYYERPASEAISGIVVKRSEGLVNKEWILLPTYKPRPDKDITHDVDGELCPMYLSRKKISVLLKAKNIMAMENALEEHAEELQIPFTSNDVTYEYTLKPEEIEAILKNQNKLALFDEE